MRLHTRRGRIVAVLFPFLLAASAAFAAEPGNSYHRRDLVSDGGVPAEHVDPNLVNGWGIAASAGACSLRSTELPVVTEVGRAFHCAAYFPPSFT